MSVQEAAALSTTLTPLAAAISNFAALADSNAT